MLSVTDSYVHTCPRCGAANGLRRGFLQVNAVRCSMRGVSRGLPCKQPRRRLLSWGVFGTGRDVSAAIVCHADRGVILFWVARLRQHERPRRARVVSARGLERGARRRRATTHGANAGLTIKDLVIDTYGDDHGVFDGYDGGVRSSIQLGDGWERWRGNAYLPVAAPPYGMLHMPCTRGG